MRIKTVGTARKVKPCLFPWTLINNDNQDFRFSYINGQTWIISMTSAMQLSLFSDSQLFRFVLPSRTWKEGSQQMLIKLMPQEIKQSTTISSEKQHSRTNGKVGSIHLNDCDCEYQKLTSWFSSSNTNNTLLILNIPKSADHTVSWRQNPVLLNLFQIGKPEHCRKSWRIEAYLHAILDTFGQSIGSSTAVTPSLE